MNKWLGIMVVMFGLAGLASAAMVDQWPMDEATWDAGGGTQGNYGNWYFKWAWSDQWSDSHWSGNTYADASWDSAHNGWAVANGNMSGNDIIRRTETLLWHVDYDGIIAWQAPETGEISLTVSVRYFLESYDDGTRNIDLSIQKNYDTWLLGNTSYEATKTPQTASLYDGTIQVNAGDWLFFRTGNASNNNAELANWSISITPEPATMGLLAVGGLGMMIRRKK